jgi:hypothetical protein
MPILGNDEPILTRTQVRAWQDRLDEISAYLMALHDEAAVLTRKLDAAKVLMEDMPPSHIGILKNLDANADDEESSDSQTRREDQLSNVVIRAVTAIPGSPKPSEIKNWILCHSNSPQETLEKAKQPYFYTVLMRHTQKGRLFKDGDGYRLPPSSPEGENRGVTPPANSLNH